MCSSLIELDRRVVKFVQRHHVLTLATIDDAGAPYCSNAFYSYDVERNAFIFASNSDSAHTTHMQCRERVSASIVLESKVIGRLQGLQVSGRIVEGGDKDRECYIKAFPFAAVTPLTLWRLEPHFMKYTDNTLGFGKKLTWQK